MIAESSAIMCILLGEEESGQYEEVNIDSPTPVLLPAGSYLEIAIVLERFGGSLASAKLDPWLNSMRIEVVPVTVNQAKLGRQIYREYGRGSRHPAKLNFGDCFSLALSLETGEPLLYKGDEFAKAGIANAINLLTG